MPSPSAAVLDNFGGTAGTALPTYDATDWARFSATTIADDLGISTPNGACTTLLGNNGSDYWKTSFAADQEVYCTLSAIGGGTSLAVVLCVRIQNPTNAATLNCYQIQWTHDPGGADTWQLIATVAGSNTTLWTDTSGTWDLAVGDKIGLQVIGTSVVVYRYNSGGSAWQTVHASSTTDSTVTGTGVTGLALLGSSGVEITAYAAGALATGTHTGSLAGRLEFQGEIVVENAVSGGGMLLSGVG